MPSCHAVICLCFLAWTNKKIFSGMSPLHIPSFSGSLCPLHGTTSPATAPSSSNSPVCKYPWCQDIHNISRYRVCAANQLPCHYQGLNRLAGGNSTNTSAPRRTRVDSWQHLSHHRTSRAHQVNYNPVAQGPCSPLMSYMGGQTCKVEFMPEE